MVSYANVVRCGHHARMVPPDDTTSFLDLPKSFVSRLSMSHPIGWKIALKRIAVEKEAKTGFIELGMLGLTELPDELIELEHLNRLNLGSAWFDLMESQWKWSESGIEINTVEASLAKLVQLPNLRELYLHRKKMTSLEPLANLHTLQMIDCSRNRLADLTPLANLHELQTLVCRHNKFSDLTPLANLHALRSIDLYYTPVSDLTPLATLQSLQTIKCENTRISNFEPLRGLTRLQEICLDANQMKIVPEWLLHYPNLKITSF